MGRCVYRNAVWTALYSVQSLDSSVSLHQGAVWLGVCLYRSPVWTALYSVQSLDSSVSLHRGAVWVGVCTEVLCGQLCILYRVWTALHLYTEVQSG